MDLSRWQVFDSLSRDITAEVKLAYTWGSAKGGYFVTSDDDVYCVGEQKYGLHDYKILSTKKMDALCGKGIKSFHYGQSRTLALTNSGKLYQWNIKIEPTVVAGIVPENVIMSQVAVGLVHILALTSEGKIFSWGGNACGQLGIGSSVESHHPQPVNLHQKIVSVGCSTAASFALTSEGDILSWGHRKENGQSSSNVHSPALLLQSKSVSQIVCGKFQGLGLTKDGKLYCWGLSNGIHRNSWEPREICQEISPIVEIAGCCHIEFFVCRAYAEKIFVWGDWFDQILEDPVQTEFKSVDEVFACSVVPTMWRTVTVRPPPHSNFLKSFASALNDEETSDIEFSVDGTKIFAHRVFLKFRVPYFRTLFQNRWKDSNQGVIEVEKFSYDVFSAFIAFVYTEKVQVKAFTDLYGLLEAADFYNVQELLVECEDLLKEGIREGNVCTIYALANRHNATNLKMYAREYIVPRFSKVVKSQDFLEMDHQMKNQLIGELAHKRKLVDANDESCVGKKARQDGRMSGVINVLNIASTSDSSSSSDEG